MKIITPILVLILILGIIGISGCTSSNSTSDQNTTANTVEKKPLPTNTTHPEAAKVVIASSKGSKEDTYYIIEGQIWNKNSFGVSFVIINATGFDKDGKIVATDWTYADDNDIPANGKSKFIIMINDPNKQIVKYSVQVYDADKSLYGRNSDKSNEDQGDFDNGYNAGQLWAQKAINSGYKWEYYPPNGGTYPEAVQKKSNTFKSGYEAGYMDTIKSY